MSLQEQRDAIVRYAQKNGLEIASWFEERETAAKQGRPGFSQMLKLLQKGKADGAIIHKVDRSARNLRDWANLVDLIDGGVDVHFVNEGLDLNSRGGRLSADIQAVIAADYIRNLREEIKKGFYGRLKQGLFPLPAPVGYLDMGKGKPKEPDPVKGPLVRKAFELYGTGRFNLDTLNSELYRLGLRNRREGRITRTGLSTILNNPFYIGLIRLKKSGEIFPGVHEPLIPKSLFDRVQSILQGKTNGCGWKHDFLFRRLLTCQHCSFSLIGETQKGYTYYRCHTPSCPTKGFREEVVEQKIEDTFSPLQLSPEETKYLRGRIATLKEDWLKEKGSHEKELKLRLGQLQDRLGRLTDAFVDGTLEKELFEERKTALLMQRKEAEEKLGQLEAGTTSIPDELEKFLERAESLYLGYKLGFSEEKREFLKIATSNRAVEGKNLRIELSIPFREVANRANFSNGGPQQDIPRTLDKLLKKLIKYFKSKLAAEKEADKSLR